MSIGKRHWLLAGGIALATAGFSTWAMNLHAATEQFYAGSNGQTAVPGRLSEAELGNLIRAMGIEAKLDERRYDFAFKANYNKQEPWTLSMSAVLSENGNSIWVIAWLDECPRSAAEVPRKALLNLLAKNDIMGNGKFFAYIPSNNRFVLQRVVANESMTTARFREILQDLGASVVETFPYWSVTNWTTSAKGSNAADSRSNSVSGQPGNGIPGTTTGPVSAGPRTPYRSQD